MKTSDFQYDLPAELIAQNPVEPRDNSRLMVVDREKGSILHRRFYDLPEFVTRGDVLVFNDSRVKVARAFGRLTDTGKLIELLFMSRIAAGVWHVLGRPGRHMGIGVSFEVLGKDDSVLMKGTVVEVGHEGLRTVEVQGEEKLLDVARIALPPYIHRPLENAERYQTVYSRIEGSVAAPTAGLHFTPGLMRRLALGGVTAVFVTLHVGWDSFRPVRSENPLRHKMHSEHYDLSTQAASTLCDAKIEGRRVISVGTTATRLLEHNARRTALAGTPINADCGWTDLFIVPGFEFRIVDALVTNFHLPRSTLLMLTRAFAGTDLLRYAYEEAVDHRYRFYSFGDAMLIF